MDTRLWVQTDRADEWLTLARPTPEVELMSVVGSTRLWTEVHTQVCLALIKPGRPGAGAKWRTRGRTLQAKGGDLMLIEPGDVHVTQAVAVASDFDVVRFVPRVFDEALQELGVRGPFHFNTPQAESAAMKDIVGRLIRAHAEGQTPFELSALIAELTTTILTELTEKGARHTLDPVRDYRLRRARDYLRENLALKPSLEALANDVGISKYRLCALFKAAYGVSVGQYWMAARIAEASRLLLANIPIKLVAATLGFVDEAFFTRIFRRHRGMPPAAWVRLQRQNSPRAVGEPLLRIA